MKVLGFADKTSASTNCNKTLQHFGDQSRGWGGKRRIDKVWNRVSHGPELSASMDEQGLCVFPTHRLMGYNGVVDTMVDIVYKDG